ncbi:hypothetical protein GCM10009789_57730 [Kribbella sancticallisti]|uniref:Uncharacterized protein n=1 Tax=Kribbella sancticallisti TaxID=460087 RepID=A0ABN2E4I3_9ACTN
MPPPVGGTACSGKQVRPRVGMLPTQGPRNLSASDPGSHSVDLRFGAFVRSVAEQQAQVARAVGAAAEDGQRGTTVVVAATVTGGLQTLKVEKCHVFTPP